MRLSYIIHSMCSENDMTISEASVLSGRARSYLAAVISKKEIGISYMRILCPMLRYDMLARNKKTLDEVSLVSEVGDGWRISVDMLYRIYAAVGCEIILRDYSGQHEYVITE